ncbi:hypothetical protein BDP55DRAFT_632490 [Colletotrichum godetiae]|uniref:RING-type domain-containing protein n=1 Tax=Colletotrichum godetiae TaxID=1209918 RepID=A0AAJ0AMW1_9PEZI|nr:uncharacterized protein BDP55DRAFT_632490 [Colletotrichum godetiae]KAK1675328.1 hypothetical protein BDP55DRAFT_632490 [Colletotrichum godetiae]
MAAANDTNALAAVAEPRTPTSTPASGPVSPGVAPVHQCRQCRASFCQPLGCGHVYCDECAGPHHKCPECDRQLVPPKPSSSEKPPKTTTPSEDGLFSPVFQKRIANRIRTMYYISLCSFWTSILVGVLAIIAIIIGASKARPL